jgi:hypothetical protein
VPKVPGGFLGNFSGLVDFSQAPQDVAARLFGWAMVRPLRRVIEERRGPALKIALALQIGFLRMTGRLLEAVRVVPPALWQHLGQQFGVAACGSGLAARYVSAPKDTLNTTPSTATPCSASILP